MKKLIFAVMVGLAGFSVFAQYNTAYDINRIGNNTGRIANAMERQNSQSMMFNMMQLAEASDAARQEAQRRHAEWFWNEIYRAVPDYRRILSERRFFNAIKRDRLTNAFEPILFSQEEIKVGKKYTTRTVWSKNSPDRAIQLLLAYKKYEEKVAAEKQKMEQNNVPSGKILTSNIIQSQGFKNWLRNKPIYARIIRENKDAGEVNQIIDEYKIYAGLK